MSIDTLKQKRVTLLNLAVTKSVVEDKKSFQKSKSEKLEKYRGENKKIFRVLKELTNKRAPRTDAINDENGVTLTEDEDKRRWTEYSSKLNGAKDHQRTYNRGREQDEPPPLSGSGFATDTKWEVIWSI